MPQKVLLVITKSVWGGAQKYVFDLATKLPRDTHSVSVALGGNGPLAKKLSKAGIRVIPVPALERDISIAKDWAAFRALLKIFRMEQPDIVHLNSSKIGLFGAVAARLASIKKIVFTAHGWIFNEDRSLPVKAFYALLSWLTGLFVTDVIVLSEYEYNQTKKLPFVIKKTHLIRNGIGEFETLPRPEARKLLPELVEGLPKLENKIVIGTISELHPNKGLEYAIRAIADVILRSKATKDLKDSSVSPQNDNSSPCFIVIGGGQDESKLRALIKELNLEGTVFLAGFINDAQRLLPAFDIFTLTSLKEGLPYVILEAGFLGLPVIASSVGAMPEIASSFLPPLEGEDQGGGSCLMLVKPKDAPSIASALKRIITDPQLRVTIGNRLKQKITADFTHQAMLQKTLGVYK